MGEILRVAELHAQVAVFFLELLSGGIDRGWTRLWL